MGISKLGSSDSDSGGGGGGVAVGWGAATGTRGAPDEAAGGLEATGISDASTCFFSIVGGRSVVECLPTVQAGMARNSSNVRTRGLQHFQPLLTSQYKIQYKTRTVEINAQAYLSVLRGISAGQDGNGIPPPGHCTSSHTTGEHISAPC